MIQPLSCLSSKDRQCYFSQSEQNQITKVTLTHVSIGQTLKAWSDLVYRDQEPMLLTLFRGGFHSIRLRYIRLQG